MDIDYALAFDFVDIDGRPYQLRFRRQHLDTGQLIAVIAKAGRPDTGHTVAISRPGVDLHDVVAALAGWQMWARMTDNTVSLPAIRRRIDEAGLR